VVKAVLFALLPASAWAASFTVAAPASLPADGKTTAVATVTIDPPGAIEATLGAGRVTVMPNGHLEITAPRLAQELEVALTVTADGGKRRASATIRFTVPSASDEIARSGGPFDLRGPARLTAGTTRESIVSLRGPAILEASAGRLSALRAAGGRFEARYTPPEGRMPRIVMFAARSPDGATLDWLPVLLVGAPQVEVKTKPFASVLVRVGGDQFGPVRADAQGDARLTVLVPPGVSEGTTVAVDRAGNSKESPLAIEAPPVNRLHAICPPGAVVALVVSNAGRPSPNESLTGQAQVGRLHGFAQRAPGVYRSTLDPGEGAERESAIEVKIASDPASRASCTAQLPGPAARLELIGPQGTVLADGASTTTARVRAFDALGNPARGVALVASAAGRAEVLAGGEVRYQAPRDFARRSDTLVVRTADGKLEVSQQVRLLPLRRPFAAGVRLGYLTNFAKVSAPLLMADFSYRFRPLKQALSLGFAAGLMWSSTTRAAEGSGEEVSLTAAGVPLLLHLGAHVALGRVGLSFGAGGGMMVAWTSFSSPSTGERAGAEVGGAASVYAGLEVPFGRHRPGVELGYLYAPISAGNIGGLHATAGYRVEF
jgi:hypothetical protein